MKHLRRNWPIYLVAAILIASWLNAFSIVWNAR